MNDDQIFPLSGRHGDGVSHGSGSGSAAGARARSHPASRLRSCSRGREPCDRQGSVLLPSPCLSIAAPCPASRLPASYRLPSADLSPSPSPLWPAGLLSASGLSPLRNPPALGLDAAWPCAPLGADLPLLSRDHFFPSRTPPPQEAGFFVSGAEGDACPPLMDGLRFGRETSIGLMQHERRTDREGAP